MPLLTFSSDFGNNDFLVGAVKGQLLQINPEFSIVDISHSISPFNYTHAAYVCRNAIKNFPDHTYHLILVNLFDKNPDQLLLAFHNNQYFLCVDNGLLTMVLEEKPQMVTGIHLKKEDAKNPIAFAKILGQVINQLIRGDSILKIGEPDVSYIEKKPLHPIISDTWIEGQIIFIDNFENVIVNITQKQFEENRKGRKFKIVFKHDKIIETISETYADVHEGEKLAIFNSAGYLEIAINKANAAGLLGLKGYSEKNIQSKQLVQNQLFYQTVRIRFE